MLTTGIEFPIFLRRFAPRQSSAALATSGPRRWPDEAIRGHRARARVGGRSQNRDGDRAPPIVANNRVDRWRQAARRSRPPGPPQMYGPSERQAGSRNRSGHGRQREIRPGGETYPVSAGVGLHCHRLLSAGFVCNVLAP